MDSSVSSAATTEIVRIDALAIEDALAVSASPGSLLVEVSDIEVLEVGSLRPYHAKIKVLAAGPPALVDRHAAAGKARRVSKPDHLLLPGMVNAHTHLDLTHIGPRPYDETKGFAGFIQTVVANRRVDDELIAESVRAGVESSLMGGVVAVGDIAGSAGGWPRIAPFEELTRSPLWGTSFVEYFAIGSGEQEGLSRLEETIEEGIRRPRRPRMRLGMSPHSPISVSRQGYMRSAELAKRHELAMMTHLAESPEEAEFIANAQGPSRVFLEKLGIWSERMLEEIGKGESPTGHLKSVLEYARCIAVHCNQLSDKDIGILHRTTTPVVFCPRASAYFQTEDAFGEHRYRDLLFCGIRVALGTDSVINLGTDGENADGNPTATLSVLDEMRLLYRRDSMQAMTLLGMVTLDAANVLGIDPIHFTFKRGAEIAGVVAVDTQRPGLKHLDLALDRILLGSGKPELLMIGK
jgi:cytosine/adenosine deaminase-related metal-dependent hydrolase